MASFVYQSIVLRDRLSACFVDKRRPDQNLVELLGDLNKRLEKIQDDLLVERLRALQEANQTLFAATDWPHQPDSMGDYFAAVRAHGIALRRVTAYLESPEDFQQPARRASKPRKTERDDEIVRLRDEEGKTFGEIPRLLMQANAAWIGKDGKPMTRDAVEKAYHRHKRKRTK